LLYVYAVTAVRSAKTSAQRLREQDGGTLDLHRQSLRQHGLLDDQASVADKSGFRREREHEEMLKAESRRQKEEARLRQLEEWKKENERNSSIWKWFWEK